MAKILRFSSRRKQRSLFEELLHSHVESLYKLAYRFTNDAMEAEDLLQDLLVKLYPKVRELEQVDNLRPWLARVMYRMWVDKQRNQRAAATDLVADVSELEQGPEGVELESIPEQAYQRAITQQKLLRALDELAEDHRMVLILFDVEGYTLEEMKMILDCPIGTLKSRLNRARERLRNLLDDGTF